MPRSNLPALYAIIPLALRQNRRSLTFAKSGAADGALRQHFMSGKDA